MKTSVYQIVWKVVVRSLYMGDDIKVIYVHGGDRIHAGEVACKKSGFEFPIAEFIDFDRYEWA